jgi:hypothetical protein
VTSRERIYHDALKRIATAESGIWGRIAATALDEGAEGVVVARGTDALLSTGGQPSDDFHGATE